MPNRRKKKRSPTRGKQGAGKPVSPAEGAPATRPTPGSRVLRAAFALGVVGTVTLLTVGLYESMRTEGRLPGISTTYIQYIDTLFDAGDHEQALQQLRLALALDIVNEPLVLNNLANALQSRGESSQAIAYYRKAIRIKPDYGMAYYNLAKAIGEQGESSEAIELYRAAVQLAPDHVDAHNNLANTLAAQGAVEEAIQHYEQALRLRPDNAAAHNNLAWVLKGAGRRDEALTHFQEAVRLQPELASSVIGLSWLLATHPEEERRDPERALVLAGRALVLLPGPDPRSLDIAATAHAAVGDYDRAVELARAAVDLAPSNFPELQAIRARLALYSQRQPYREPR